MSSLFNHTKAFMLHLNDMLWEANSWKIMIVFVRNKVTAWSLPNWETIRCISRSLTMLTIQWVAGEIKS